MLLLLLACKPDPSVKPDPEAPDLTERLGADQVRAGVVTDAAALFGGISAEGDVGDVKIYDDRVQFVIQAAGESSYYLEYGGALIDADLVREEGEPGRDIVDEAAPMIGLGRLVDATSVEVVSDGSDGRAVVRVEGPAATMKLVTGALESEGIIQDYDLHVVTEYELLPGAWSLRATTTIRNDEDDAVTLQPGEIALVALDVAEGWRAGTGRGEADGEPFDLTAITGKQGEVTLALASDGEPLESGLIGEMLGSMAPAAVGFGPSTTIEPGASASWSRWIGVGPDVATLTGEKWARDGETETVSGTVTADGTHVAGARVHVLQDGDPITVAQTAADGTWSAELPPGDYTYVATGRGASIQVDLPAGAGWLSPYEHDPEATLATITNGAPGPAFAEGYGVGEAGTSPDLTLTAPGELVVNVEDGGPAVVQVAFAAGDPVAADDRLVPGRPGGYAALGYIRDGSMALRLEPGDYVVTVSRGVRYEASVSTVTVNSGQQATLFADLTPAYTLDGVVTIDPHSHASPSGDGGIPMADRVLVAAANGVDVHVGTDHDHVADYRPLIPAMGLDAWVKSVVADEVSPVLRGHFNVYPATLTADLPNHGAPRWWFGYVDTEEIFGWMRTLAGDTGIVQANHPVGSSGMFSFAGYDANGTYNAPDHWSDDFDAMELLNSNDYTENLPYYLDLVRRGKRVTPTGVSDSHTHTGGDVGLNLTFLHTGGTLADFDDAALIDAMRARATVVSHGPYIDARVDGEWAPGAEVAGDSELAVDVYSPSWMPVDTLELYEDGTLIDSIPCTGAAPTPCTASWILSPLQDATYVVIASGSTGMTAVFPGQRAWAATSAIYLDAEGDGWTAPFAPVESGG